jgi:hypothetical protein
MMFPPSLLRLRVRDGNHRIGIWFPLVLVWPVVLTIGLLLSPLVIVASIILWPFGWGKTLLLAGPMLFRTFCALRGLRLSVEQPAEEVLIYFK